ncbi:unnamed protein product, partial [Mesorhabditis belari]|uniref:Ankyrin repeat protein n=1 Tax=Mesorhabditis belari TaxID=2138241 RepID=A0AAF3FAZ7_9BILA
MLICRATRHSTQNLRIESEHTQLNLIQDLYFAVRASRVDLVRHLLFKLRVNPKINIQKVSILTVAVERNSPEIVRMLLDQGVDVNTFSEAFAGSLETPLFTAVKMGHTAVVHLLLYYGADPNLADFANRTPLYMAVQCNREEEALALIVAGANLNTADKTGTTALQVASRGFGREMLALHLINHGAYVHQADFKGRTAIELALTAGNTCVLQMLLDAGAQPGKALSERITNLLAHPEVEDFCAEKTLRSLRRTLPMEIITARKIRDSLINKEKLRKTGRSIWKEIDRLAIPENVKLELKIHVHIDGFNI